MWWVKDFDCCWFFFILQFVIIYMYNEFGTRHSSLKRAYAYAADDGIDSNSLCLMPYLIQMEVRVYAFQI